MTVTGPTGPLHPLTEETGIRIEVVNILHTQMLSPTASVGEATAASLLDQWGDEDW